ncbi:uncharacterized protein LOC122299103 [Carya illinoinensis]|uniref:uncharacterized protein LOC122299103 n=1 Tax=Carya illinoinensis TaxID=32201 RepID=UPI001C729A43|nr:uncharacterized protein LOC122299103 [Carya illinoinensis]
MSSLLSYSLFAKRIMGQPLCFCTVEATLRYSTRPRNQGRPFFGCRKYNKEGLPYCKYFKWTDSNDDIDLELQKRKDDILMNEKEFEKILEVNDIEKREIKIWKRGDEIEKKELELHKRGDETEERVMVLSVLNPQVLKKELAFLEQQAQITRSHTLLWMY